MDPYSNFGKNNGDGGNNGLGGYPTPSKVSDWKNDPSYQALIGGSIPTFGFLEGRTLCVIVPEGNGASLQLFQDQKSFLVVPNDDETFMVTTIGGNDEVSNMTQDQIIKQFGITEKPLAVLNAFIEEVVH